DHRTGHSVALQRFQGAIEYPSLRNAAEIELHPGLAEPDAMVDGVDLDPAPGDLAARRGDPAAVGSDPGAPLLAPQLCECADGRVECAVAGSRELQCQCEHGGEFRPYR